MSSILEPSRHSDLTTLGLAAERCRPQAPSASITAYDAAFFEARQTTSAKRLMEPGPTEHECASIFAAAATAPDHGRLLPWRFVVIPEAKRELLAEAFALALIDRSPGATLEQIEDARAKARRSPFLALAVVRLAAEPDPAIPNAERLVSLGCALQNMLLAAQALGFGSGLTSGRSVRSQRLRDLFRLGVDEECVCFVNIGTVAAAKAGRIRPGIEQIASYL